MERNAVLGELLYILSNYQKGRIKIKGIWQRKYLNSLKESILIIQIIIGLLQSTEDVSIDMIFPVIEYLKRNKDIIFPLNNKIMEQWENDNFALVSGVSSESKYISIIQLMNEIVDEMLTVLKNRGTKYKVKITYLLQAFHNLPKVYLNTEIVTLCNIGIRPICEEDALEYASSYLKQKGKLD